MIYFLNSMPITASKASVYGGKLKKMRGNDKPFMAGLVRDALNNIQLNRRSLPLTAQFGVVTFHQVGARQQAH